MYFKAIMSLALTSNSNENTMQFIDLAAQYQHLKVKIDKRIQTVLDHGQYIMGPEVLTII